MARLLGRLHVVIPAGRNSGEIVGAVHFGPFENMGSDEFAIGLKLMGQVNLVIAGRSVLADGGSITLTSGILSEHPIRSGCKAAFAVRARCGAHRQHLGLSVGQARLRRDVVCDRAQQRLDIGELRRSAPLRGVRCARARGDRARKGARDCSHRIQGVRPGAPGASTERAHSAIAALAAYTSHGAKTHSRVWRDLAVRKRKTEVDQQIAIIGKIGAEMGIRTPAINRLVELIHDVGDGRRELSFDTFQELIDTCTSDTTVASRS